MICTHEKQTGLRSVLAEGMSACVVFLLNFFNPTWRGGEDCLSMAAADAVFLLYLKQEHQTCHALFVDQPTL